MFYSWFRSSKSKLQNEKSPLRLAYGLFGKLNSARYTSRPLGVSSSASKLVFIQILYHNFLKTSSTMKAALIGVVCGSADDAGLLTLKSTPAIECITA
jgi:hypothetical protein